MKRLSVDVSIVGAGPAGLTLANVLREHGITSVVVEKVPRATVETKARAGLVEHRTVAFLEKVGLADGLLAHGMRHGSCTFSLRSGGPVARMFAEQYAGE